MKLVESEVGTEIRFDNFLIFFGNRNSNRKLIEEKYSNFQLSSIHQVHGNKIVQVSQSTENAGPIQADAHWAEEKSLGLLISTADCLPVMVIDPDLQIIVAIHAGWRGIQSEIIPMALEFVSKSAMVFIGPHILIDSFEIDNVNRDSLLKTVSNLKQSDSGISLYKNSNEGKSFVDLLAIAKLQINQNGILLSSIFSTAVDTKKNLNYHSYRRDKEKSGRQISFVARIG